MQEGEQRRESFNSVEVGCEEMELPALGFIGAAQPRRWPSCRSLGAPACGGWR